MPYISLSSFKLPFIQNKKEVAQLKQTVILKSYGVLHLTWKEIEKKPHTHQISPEP